MEFYFFLFLISVPECCRILQIPNSGRDR
jgi:hypothetical protein